MRKCYIAKYPLSEDGKDLKEVILKKDAYFTEEISQCWDDLVSRRQSNEPMLQCWYSDKYQATCLASTNQPFKLD